MPDQSKRLTLLRQWETLNALPRSHGVTVKQIRERLRDAGFDIDERSVQRDLKLLSESFPVEIDDDERPFRYRLARAANVGGLSSPEALALLLVERHLHAALPATMMDGFEPLFERARGKLASGDAGAVAPRWLDLVRVVPPALPVIAPRVDPGIREAVADALLRRRQLEASYTPHGAAEAKAYRLHPLGLVLRDPVTYLVAAAFHSRKPRMYALHRFGRAEILPDAARVPPDFDLDAALNEGLGQFGPGTAGGKAPIALRIECAPWVTTVLEEAPLSADQTVQRGADGCGRVSATVSDSWQLRWWLLSKGADVKVIGPVDLRDEIRSALSAALARYSPPTAPG